MADTKIIKSATEASAVIITQPSLSSTQTTGPNEVLENATNTAFLDNEADVITTQPLMNPETDEEHNQKKKFSQFNPAAKPPENIQQQANGDSCAWCCLACTDCTDICVDCAQCCNECCYDFGDCCANCCEGGSGDAGNIDGADVVGCLECCGACLECCNDN